MIINPYAFGAGVVVVPDPEGFRGEAASAQTFNAAQYDTVTLGTEVFDTESAFASNVLTVPAGWDGELIEITGTCRVGFGAGNPTEVRTAIERDSGSGYEIVAYGAVAGGSCRYRTAFYVGLGATGDTYRLRFYCAASRDSLTGANVSLAGGPLLG